MSSSVGFSGPTPPPLLPFSLFTSISPLFFFPSRTKTQKHENTSKRTTNEPGKQHESTPTHNRDTRRPAHEQQTKNKAKHETHPTSPQKESTAPGTPGPTTEAHTTERKSKHRRRRRSVIREICATSAVLMTNTPDPDKEARRLLTVTCVSAGCGFCRAGAVLTVEKFDLKKKLQSK